MNERTNEWMNEWSVGGWLSDCLPIAWLSEYKTDRMNDLLAGLAYYLPDYLTHWLAEW